MFIHSDNACTPGISQDIHIFLLDHEFEDVWLVRFVVVAGDTCVSPRTNADVSMKLSTQFAAKIHFLSQYSWPNHQYLSIIKGFQVVWGDFETFIDACCRIMIGAVSGESAVSFIQVTGPWWPPWSPHYPHLKLKFVLELTEG